MTIVASLIPATMRFLRTKFFYPFEVLQNSVIKPPFSSTLATYFYAFWDKFGLNHALPPIVCSYGPSPSGAQRYRHHKQNRLQSQDPRRQILYQFPAKLCAVRCDLASTHILIILLFKLICPEVNNKGAINTMFQPLWVIFALKMRHIDFICSYKR
jgi:hypothetical protein